jgi:hypothetical protein
MAVLLQHTEFGGSFHGLSKIAAIMRSSSGPVNLGSAQYNSTVRGSILHQGDQIHRTFSKLHRESRRWKVA